MKQPSLNDIALNVPEIPVLTLSCGIPVHLVNVPNTEMVNFCMMFGGGQWNQDCCLQSDFAMQQITSGSQNMSCEVIEEKLDYYGATITAGANLSFVYVKVDCVKRNFAEAIKIFQEVLNAPSYDLQRLQMALEEGMMAYKLSQQRVGQMCKRLYYQSLLGNLHPASNFPVEESYSQLSREDVLRYWHKNLRNDNARIILSGNVDEDVIKVVDECFGSSSIIEAKPFDFRHHYVPCNSGRFESNIEVPSVQSCIRMGTVLPDNSHKDYPALQLFSTIIGGYFGSRLMKNIRERLGFTYGIGSMIHRIPHNNIFIIATETPREHVNQCVDEIINEIRLLQTQPISGDELKLTLNYITGQLCRSTEISLKLPDVLMGQIVLGHSLDAYVELQRAMRVLTADDLMRVANEYFSIDNILTAVVHGK